MLIVVVIVSIPLGIKWMATPEVEFTTPYPEFGTKVYADLVNARPEYADDDTVFCYCEFANGTSALVGFTYEDFAEYFDADPHDPDMTRTYTPVYDIRIHGDMRQSSSDSLLKGQRWICCSSVEILQD